VLTDATAPIFRLGGALQKLIIYLEIKENSWSGRAIPGAAHGAVKSAPKRIPSARAQPRAVLFSRSLLDERPSRPQG
jgi:hypothetical protein